MTDRKMGSSSEHRWSAFQISFSLLLFAGGIGCIVMGALPFIQQMAGRKNIANIGFMVLIAMFMLGFFKVKRTGRFLFWAMGFTLILYTNLMFLFYDNLFDETGLYS